MDTEWIKVIVTIIGIATPNLIAIVVYFMKLTVALAQLDILGNDVKDMKKHLSKIEVIMVSSEHLENRMSSLETRIIRIEEQFFNK